MAKVAIFTNHDVKNAYSCLFYLKNELSKKYEVDMYARTIPELINDREKNHYYYVRNNKLRDIKFLGGLSSRIKFLLRSFKYDVLIINDLDFFELAYYIKKFFPKKKVIHYNTEIHGKDIPYNSHIVNFYSRHANFPDMIIECLAERAEYRKKTFGVSQQIFVIDNTLPVKEVESILNKDINTDQYFNFPNHAPIMIYAGGCGMNRGLGQLIPLIGKFKNKLNFLLFCYGTNDQINELKKSLENCDNCKVENAVSRDVLYNVMNKCNFGLQCYPPDFSVNYLYASPSKFFEYIALGVSVISTDNIGINKMIKSDSLGICMNDELDLEAALNTILETEPNRDQIKEIFREKYCYEIDSIRTITEIERVVGSDYYNEDIK